MSPTAVVQKAGNVLLGKVVVEPGWVRPGQSTRIQACDLAGNPYGPDSGVLITIQGIPASSRYLQFATPGNRDITVRAVRGTVDESVVVTVQVVGDPLSFRRTLQPPVATAIPILQVVPDLTNPYLAVFTLGTPRTLLPSLAQALAAAPPAAVPGAGTVAAVSGRAVPGFVSQPVPPASATGGPAPPPSAPTPAMADFGAQVSQMLGTAPPRQIVRIPMTTETLPNGSVSRGYGSFAPSDGLVLPIPIQTSYEWSFGDGTTATTQTPTVTHDYFPAIRAGDVARGFDVTCTVVHDGLSVTRTLVIISPYGISRQFGLVVPRVTGDVFASFQKLGFSGTFVLNNLEAAPIVLTRMAVVPLSRDPSANLPSPQFTTLDHPVTVPANQSAAIGVYVLLGQLGPPGTLGPNVPGFIVHYQGSVGDATAAPVIVSHTFRIPLSASGMVAKVWQGGILPSTWDAGNALAALSAAVRNPATPLVPAQTPVVDPRTRTAAITLSGSPARATEQALVRSSLHAGLLAGIGGAPRTTAPLPRPLGGPAPPGPNPAPPPPPPGPVQEGQICDPDNISAADGASAAAQGLVCQLTNVTQTVEMPGAFQNALMGDVILSPGGDGSDQTIASLLRALSPPQYHSHSGMMTQNFYQITHCTASAERFADYTVGPGGSLGIQSDVLQYGWPGSITQSIDDATSGATWIDPGGRSYTIGGFTPEALGIMTNDGFVLVPPLVVKPLPQNEATARPFLRNAAAIALGKGATVDASGNPRRTGGCYYSFYGYTKPEISAGFTDSAPAAAAWAQGLSPAVCSSFVWLCMKAAGIPVVTSRQYEIPSDLSAAAVAQGAEVGAGTLDGLFYYSQSERQAAAAILDQIFQNQILNHEGFFQYIPLLSAAVAMSIADQIMNEFALGNPNMYGSNAWLTSGDANAVSPDNIRWWNPPYFGSVEPLQYLPRHTEQYTISRWARIVTLGSVSGVVTINGAPVAGAYVYVYDGMSTTSDAAGHYALNNVPTGSYQIKASVVEGGITYSTQQAITLAPRYPNLTVNLALATNPETFRVLQLNYEIVCGHSDLNPWHAQGNYTQGPDQQSVPVNPGLITNSTRIGYEYATGGLFHIDYDIRVTLAEDLSLQVTITATMYDDGGGYQGQNTISFNVPKDGQYAWELDLTTSGLGYTNGPSAFTGTATNLADTG